MSKILVLGAGESGTGAALLAQHLGMEVLVSDAGQIAPHYLAELQAAGIPCEEGGHDLARLLAWAAPTVVKSPGIPDTAPVVKALEEAGAEIVDELEFASRYTRARLIAITGSNGKTTTTRLIHHLLAQSGMAVGLGGNIGKSLARQLMAAEQPEVYVLEVSSFQLDRCYSFRPSVGLILNITPDHLDRYGYDYKRYMASKWRMAQNKQPEDLLIYGQYSPAAVEGLKAFYQGTSDNLLGVDMADLSPEAEFFDLPGDTCRFETAKLPLKGRHNLFNMRCAALVARHLGLSCAQIQAGLERFINEPHRLEWVCDLSGVSYINDSKATNVDAVFYALEAMTKPVVWIVGGVDKGNDYSELFDLVRAKVRAIVCLGLDNSPIFKAFKEVHPLIEETRSLSEALKVAGLYAEPGDVVLLSPACASFDLFKNYQDRGTQFRELLLAQQRLLTEGLSFHFTINLGGAESISDSTPPC